MSADPYVRLTVRGAARTAEVVLPTDLTLEALLPELLDLLGQPGGAERYGVFTDTGHRLTPDTPLAQLDVVDGRRVRLVPLADAPAEPVVHDLVDRLAAADVRGLWGPATRPWVLALLGVVPVLAALWWLRGSLTQPWIPVLALLAAAVGAHTARLRASAWVLLGAAALVGLAGLPAVLAGQGGADWPGGAAGWLVSLAGAVLLAGGLLAGHPRAAALAATVLAGFVAVSVVTLTLGATPAQAAGVLGVAALLVLGLLPRASMAGAGLFAVDDAVARGDRVTVPRVAQVVAEAHAALTATVVVTAAAMGVALWGLSGPATSGIWAAALAAVLALAFLVRSRHFPLAAHRLVVWGAVLAGALAVAASLVAGAPDAPVLPGLAAGAAAVGLVLLALPAAPEATALRSAQARRVAGAVERVCVLAAVPLLVGLFGVYGQLLGSFR